MQMVNRIAQTLVAIMQLGDRSFFLAFGVLLSNYNVADGFTRMCVARTTIGADLPMDFSCSTTWQKCKMMVKT